MMHSGHRARLRQRFFEEGLSGFAPHEALELLLCFAIPQRDVNPLAHQLIERFGSLSAVLEARPEELMETPGVGPNAAALLALMPQLMRYYERDKQRERPRLNNLERAGAYCRSLLRGRKNECVYLLCLDAKGYLIKPVLMHQGTIDESQLYPREIVRETLLHNAYAVLIAHNHPGGEAMPSRGDYDATLRVMEALRAIDVRLIDHIIVSDDALCSLTHMHMIEKGQLVSLEDFDYRVRMASMPTARRGKVLQTGATEGYDGLEED